MDSSWTNNGTIIGESKYSTIYEGNFHGERVAIKEVTGFTTYFLDTEERINIKLSTTVDKEGRELHIVKFKARDNNNLIFELCESDLEKMHSLSPIELSRMISDVLMGIELLDKLHISHRDLYRIPNIFFKDGTFKIGDFGLSIIVRSNPAEQIQQTTGNLSQFAALLYQYIGQKVLGLQDVLEKRIDLMSLIKESKLLKNESRGILSNFFEIKSNELTYNSFRHLAISLGSLESW